MDRVAEYVKAKPIFNKTGLLRFINETNPLSAKFYRKGLWRVFNELGDDWDPPYSLEEAKEIRDYMVLRRTGFSPNAAKQKLYEIKQENTNV